MPEALDWQRADPRDALARVLELLKAGQLVAFPTETGYTVAACALAPGAASRLAETSRPGEGQPLTVAVAAPGAALDWAPALSKLGRRLARRCWPGPLTLVSGAGVAQGLAGRMPEAARVRAVVGGALRLRTPAHEAILEVMRLRQGPLLLAEGDDGPPSATAGQILEALGEKVALVIDDGPGRFTLPPTVVRVDGEDWQILREGVLSRAVVERLLPCRIVFVCTGNTCRSPLAEALCKKLLAERLGCAPQELPERGFLVISAGISAMMGGEATPEAVATASELGADLAGHRSQPLTHELLAQADHLIAMTRGHLRALAGHGGPPARLLARDGADVPDPIGATPEVYRQCAAQVLGHLEALLPELQ
jgi:protein-tyrosine phosphatase